MRRRRILVPVALAAGLLCLAAGCGDDETPSVPQTGNVPTTLAEPTTTATSGDGNS